MIRVGIPRKCKPTKLSKLPKPRKIRPDHTQMPMFNTQIAINTQIAMINTQIAIINTQTLVIKTQIVMINIEIGLHFTLI